MNPAQLDQIAGRFEQQQAAYEAALSGLFARVLERPDASASSARTYLDHASWEVMKHFYDVACMQVLDLTLTATAAGVAQAGRALPKQSKLTLDELVHEATSELYAEILAVMQRDILTVRRAWQRYAIEVVLANPQYGKNAARFLVHGRVTALKFRYPDRGGKLWDSPVMLRTLVRAHLVTVQSEACLFTLAKAGVDTAQATWPDQREPLKFSISGKNKHLDSYLSIKDGLFHPNSTATVEPV